MERNFMEVHKTGWLPERRVRHKRRHEFSRRITSMLRGRQKYSLARFKWRTLQTIRARRSDSLTCNRTDRSDPSLNDLDLHLIRQEKSCGYRETYKASTSSNPWSRSHPLMPGISSPKHSELVRNRSKIDLAQSVIAAISIYFPLPLTSQSKKESVWPTSHPGTLFLPSGHSSWLTCWTAWS